jgi:hypothetical protein
MIGCRCPIAVCPWGTNVVSGWSSSSSGRTSASRGEGAVFGSSLTSTGPPADETSSFSFAASACSGTTPCRAANSTDSVLVALPCQIRIDRSGRCSTPAFLQRRAEPNRPDHRGLPPQAAEQLGFTYPSVRQSTTGVDSPPRGDTSSRGRAGGVAVRGRGRLLGFGVGSGVRPGGAYRCFGGWT